MLTLGNVYFFFLLPRVGKAFTQAQKGFVRKGQRWNNFLLPALRNMRSPSPHSDLPPLKNVRKVLSKSTQHMPSLHLFMPSAEAANHLFDRQTRDMHPVIRLTPRNPRREFRLYKKTGRKEGRMGNRAIFPPPPPP